MIDLAATIAAMRATGMDDTMVLNALACVRLVHPDKTGSPPDNDENPPDTAADKRREYDRKRKADARARARMSTVVSTERTDSPPDKADTSATPSSSASPLVPPLSPAPLSPPIIPPPPPPPPAGELAPKRNSQPDGEKPQRKGTRLPADFVPDETAEALARELKFTKADWTRAQQEFRDYWAGVPGAKGCKLDWQATFRNSIRRFSERKPQHGHPYQSARQSHAADVQAALARQAHFFAGDGQADDFGSQVGGGPVIDGDIATGE